MQGDDQPGAHSGVGDSVEQAIARIQRVAGKIHLRDKAPVTGAEDGEMNMRRPHPICRRRIGRRLDGAEAVSAVGIGDVMAIALKVRVERRIAPIPRMVVAAETVGLSNFDPGIRHRLAGEVEDAPGEVEKPPLRPAACALNGGEVIVLIERLGLGIERSHALARRRIEQTGDRLAQRLGGGEPTGGNCGGKCCAERAAAGQGGGFAFHGLAIPSLHSAVARLSYTDAKPPQAWARRSTGWRAIANECHVP